MSNDAGSNVVTLRAPDRTGASRHAQQFEQLLQECRDLTCERLSQSLAGMLDKAADTLWEWSNATQDRDTQRLYQEVKDKLPGKRSELEERFRSHYLTQFDDRAGRACKTKASFSDYAETSLELGLVGEDDLNETLKANEMAAKLRAYCEEELVALDQRVGVLLGDADLQADNNPFDPRAICDAFKNTCRDVEPELNHRIVLVRLFDDHVLDDIRSIYKAVNALLVQHSILPKIRYGVSRNQERAGAAAAADSAGGAPGGNAPAAAGGEQDVFSVLQGLLGMNAKAAAPAGGAPMAGVGGASTQSMVEIPGFPPILGLPGQTDAIAAQTLLQGAALLGSLTRIQQGDLSVLGGALSLPASGADAGATNVLRELKASVGSGMGQMDVATLDIMAMLFDQILEDRKIPDGMKWLIGRLQIPMLKVAILDKSFFSSSTHPARQLLDTMGELAIGLPTDFGSTHPLYSRIEGVIQKLIDGFQDSLDIFDVLRQELQDLITEDNRRIEEQTRGTTTRIEQKEKLGVAKAIAQEEIRSRVRGVAVPRPIRKFLAQVWVKLLLVTHAKRGKDSDAWKSALETMDQLVWSVRPKPTPDERRKLAALLPGLLKRLAAGMQIVGVNDDLRTRFFADLMKLHTAAMDGPATEADVAADSASAHTIEAGVAKRTESAEIGKAVAAAPAASTPDPRETSKGAPAAPVTPKGGRSDSGKAVSAAPGASKPGASETGKAVPAASGASKAGSSETGKAASAAPVASKSASGETTKAATAAPAATSSAAESDVSSDPLSLDFTTVVIKNPFGEGEVEVDEIELPRVPGAPAVAVKDGDKYSRLASELEEGAWLEFRDEKQRHQVRLSYVSPFKSTFLFVNRQGQTVGEYGLHELAAEMRAGRAVVMKEVPMFDRAMSSLMGALRG